MPQAAGLAATPPYEARCAAVPRGYDAGAPSRWSGSGEGRRLGAERGGRWTSRGGKHAGAHFTVRKAGTSRPMEEVKTPPAAWSVAQKSSEAVALSLGRRAARHPQSQGRAPTVTSTARGGAPSAGQLKLQCQGRAAPHTHMSSRQREPRPHGDARPTLPDTRRIPPRWRPVATDVTARATHTQQGAALVGRSTRMGGPATRPMIQVGDRAEGDEGGGRREHPLRVRRVRAALPPSSPSGRGVPPPLVVVKGCDGHCRQRHRHQAQ